MFKYLSFGECRNSQGTLSTDRLFTGQRLDATGLYYYNARYYDATIGRFISPDATGQKLTDPQTLNRYTYCQNNPLKYTDPTGHWPHINWNTVAKIATVVLAIAAVATVAIVAPALVAALAPALAAPIAAAISGAAVSATAYTATKIATNTIKDQAPLAGWNGVDCATAAVGGAYIGYGTSIVINALTSATTSALTTASSTENAIEQGAINPRIGTPLEGVKDAPRVYNSTDPYHNFPRAYDSLSRFGEVSTEASKYGPTTQIKLNWCYDEKWGQLQWGINEQNELYHRLFLPYK